MTDSRAISTFSTESSPETDVRCSIIVPAGDDLSMLNNYLLFLNQAQLPCDYEIVIANEHGLHIDEKLLGRYSLTVKILNLDTRLSQEQLFNKIAIAVRGTFLLFVRKFIKFDKLVLEEAIRNLDASGDKIGVSADGNFLLAESSFYVEIIMQIIRKTDEYIPLDQIICLLQANKLAAQWTPQDQRMLDFYSQFISPGDLCFDVGANIGNRTKIFLKLGAKVVAVEPQDDCVRCLKVFYGRENNLKIIQKALGESQGRAELMVCSANTMSSMSREWLDSVKKSGKFGHCSWDKTQTVSMTTLDQLVEEYGIPAFTKIDVEGFEYEVLKGLSQPLKALSLEFAPEFITSMFKCIEHLQSLGQIQLNYSLGETMHLVSDKWISPEEMVETLKNSGYDSKVFGDVYVKFLNAVPVAGISCDADWAAGDQGGRMVEKLPAAGNVEIITVGGTQATDKKCSPAIGSNVRRAAAHLDKDKYPKISIVTPSYNQKGYLEECICSVLDQGYPNLEYVIMDGGSTDGSVEIVKKYANYLTYWQSKPDDGQYAAINEGFKRTTGEIMTWLNSDDKFHPNAFKTVVSVFMHRKDIGWIMGRPNTFNEQGQLFWIEKFLPLWSHERYLRKDYKFIQQEGTFWRRSLWEKAGATLQVNLDLAGDLELWARFFRFAQLYTVDALIAGYRYHPGQKAQLFMDKYIEEAEKILDREILLFKEEKYLLPAHKPILISEIKEFLPSDADEINRQGQELLTKGDFVGALDAFMRAIEIVPDSVFVHNNIGRLYLQKGEPASALKHFTQALKIDSHDRLTVLNCGQLLATNGRIEDAGKLYWSYLQRHPDDKEIANILTKLEKDRAVEVPNDKYLVSAIVSTYNSERFIRGCLEDLENQTIADRLEIIVVNSNSQQNEEAIVKEFQRKYDNIKYIRTDQRETIYRAWNLAIEAASGKYITNANTDDRHRKDALQIMADTLLANPDVALVYADQIRTNTPNDSFAGHHGVEMLPRPDYSRQRLVLGCCVGSQPMWRKSLHNEFGYFDDTLICAGDWDFWLRISSKYKFKRIPEFLGLYYYNKDGIEHGKKIHSLYERYVVGKRYGTPYISVIPLYQNRNNLLVSVIMPAYNAAEYIAEAIESVLIQNYRNIELIVVNDGSTDQTEDKVLRFKDKRIRYFCRENKGPAGACNLGIKNSRGDFLVRLDSDDMMTPDFITKHLQEFDKHPEADLVYCDDCLIGEDDNTIRIIERPEYSGRKSLIRDLFRCGFPVVPFRTCIRKSVFDKVGLFDEKLLVAEDYDMMRRFVKNGLKAHHLKGALYLRRMTSDSLSANSTDQKAKCHFEVFNRFADTFTCEELFPDIAWGRIASQRRQLCAKCLTAVTCLAIGQSYVKSNSPACAKAAFDHACSDLKDCLNVEPNNRLFRQLLHKSELVCAGYALTMQESACSLT